MDTNVRKTPVPLTFAGWRSRAPAEAAAEVHRRVAALPEPLRRAALAQLTPVPRLAAELAAAPAAAPLGGVPFLVKDLFDVAGLPTGAGSTFLAGVRPTPGDSALVRLLRSRGAALAGKTHLVEFASGLTGENPHFGDCPHPFLADRLSGGSSSGSAALVAAGVAPLALGTDTGGSVRVPAAFCGLYGFRLTPGDALIRDAFPLSPTMDTAGWFTGHAADMRTAIEALVGGTTAARSPRGCFLRGRSLFAGMDPAIDASCERAAAGLAPRIDGPTESALLDGWRGAVDAYLTIGMTEAHAVHRDWLGPHRAQYDPVIWQRFTEAGRWPAERAAQARAVMLQVRRGWEAFFRAYDFLVLPSAPVPAPTKAGCTAELRRSIIALTSPASLGGLPCLSLPVPLGAGLTVGLQVIAREPASPVFSWALGKDS